MFRRLTARRARFSAEVTHQRFETPVPQPADLVHPAGVSAICLGMAASGAAVLLAAGAAGKRMALPNSRVLIHQPHGGEEGQAVDMENQAREIAFLRRRVDQILAHHTGQPLERVKTDTDRDFVLGAEEAATYGLVDEVLTARRGLTLSLVGAAAPAGG